jgi:hypothetical protein
MMLRMLLVWMYIVQRTCQNLRDSHENTSTATKSANKVTDNGKSTNAGTTEGSSSGNDTLELTVHGLITVTGHNKTLLLELLGNIARAGTGDLDPGLGEGGACSEHVYDEESSVNGVEEGVLEVKGRGPVQELLAIALAADIETNFNLHVVDKTGDGEHLRRALTSLPDSDHLDQKVVAEARVEHLTDEEDVGGKSRLEHDGHVGGVEETNGVRTAHTTLARGLDGDLDAETLEVDDGAEDGNGSDQVHDVGQVLAVEGLLEGKLLVGPGDQKVDKGDNGTLELGTSASVDGGGRESLPDDRLADVGGDEERDTTSETVALLEELIEEDDDQSGGKELDNEENADTGTEVGGLAIETGQDVNAGLTEGQDDGKELGRSALALHDG